MEGGGRGISMMIQFIAGSCYYICCYIHHTVSGGIYNELRFWATATGAASRERPEETAREEEGENSESAACSKCGYVCLFVCIFNKSKSMKCAPPINTVRSFVERRKPTNQPIQMA